MSVKRRALTSVTIALAWFASLGAVFFLGMLLAFTFHRDPRAGLAPETPPAERELALLLEKLTGEPPDLSAVFGSSRGEAFPAPVQAAWEALLREADPNARQYLSRQLATSLPPSLVARSVEVVQAMPPGSARQDLLEVLLEQWAKRDGRSALTYAQTVLGASLGERGVLAALAGWAQTRPDDAWNWVNRHPTGEAVQADRFAEVVWMTAYTDPEAAFARANTLPSGLARREVLLALTDFLVNQQTPEVAAAWLEQLPPGTERQAAKARLTNSWAAWDATAAFDWALEQPPGNDRRELLQLAANGWLQKEGPLALATWLNDQTPHPDYDGAIQAVALGTISSDPVLALQWAQALADPTERTFTTTLVAERWLEQDPAAADALATLLTDTQVRNAVLGEPEAVPTETVVVDVEAGEAITVAGPSPEEP